jgi:CheY-like chemotaxis protein
MKRILIAEDNDSNYLLMTYVLRNHYEMLRAENGRDAVMMVDSLPVDLVLMDMKMPYINGLEATRQIKAKHPKLPVFMVTANVFDVDQESAKEAGCDAFIPKPIRSESLMDKIKEFIGE